MSLFQANCGSLSVYAAILLGLACSVTRADEKTQSEQKQTNRESSSDMTEAIQAARLAVEGVRRRSPMLLLAAAELAGGLKKGTKGTGGISIEVSAPQRQDTPSLPPLEPKALIARAIEFCGDDAALKSAVEALAQKLTSGNRGIVFSQGKDLPKMSVAGTTFVIINTDRANQQLNPGATYSVRNVIFEGKRPAHVVVVGDGDGDLDLFVYDQNTGDLIDKDADYTSVCEVRWVPLYEGPFRLVVQNTGKVWEQFYVLTNW